MCDIKVVRLHKFLNQPELKYRFSDESSEEDEDYSPTYSNQKSPYSNFASLRPTTTVYDEDDEEGVEKQKYGKHDVDYSESDHKLKELNPLKSYEHKYLNKFDDYKKKPLQNSKSTLAYLL